MAFTPATVPLSIKMPVLTVVVPVHTVTKPLVPPANVPPAPVWSVTQERFPEESLCRILLVSGRAEGQ